MRKGAAYVSNHRIDSVPFADKENVNRPKSEETGQLTEINTQDCQRFACKRVLTDDVDKGVDGISSIQVWMPNHPHATSPRKSAGMFAPKVPNDDRSKTGKGTPCLVPA